MKKSSFKMLLHFLGASLLFSIISLDTYSQDTNTIFSSCDSAINSIKNGSYNISHKMKYMTDNDTSNTNSTCNFQKVFDSDTIKYIKYKLKINKNSTAIYDGTHLLYINNPDSGEANAKRYNVLKKERSPYLDGNWASDLLYRYIFKKDIQIKGNIDTTEYFFNFEGIELVNGESCFKYFIRAKDTIESKFERTIWIGTKSFFPVKIINVYWGEMGVQYDESIISNYQFNLPSSLINIQADSVSGIPIVDYVAPPPYVEPDIKIFPSWKFVTLKGDTVRSSDYKGHFSFYDFTYISCYPCYLSIPSVENIYNDFKDKGLKVLSINPYDKDSTQLSKYISDRGISYPYLLGGKDVVASLGFRGYPTFYLVNKKNKVVHKWTGFGEGSEADWNKEIKKHFK